MDKKLMTVALVIGAIMLTLGILFGVFADKERDKHIVSDGKRITALEAGAQALKTGRDELADRLIEERRRVDSLYATLDARIAMLEGRSKAVDTALKRNRIYPAYQRMFDK